MTEQHPLNTAEWRARAEHLERQLERTRFHLWLAQIAAVTLFFALAGVIAFR